MPMYSPEEMWVMGILEGEASFGTNGRSKSPLLRVGMTDKDTMDRVAAVLTGGYWYEQKLASGKTCYYYHLTGKKAYQWMSYFRGNMSSRRRARIDEILTEAPESVQEEYLATV